MQSHHEEATAVEEGHGGGVGGGVSRSSISTRNNNNNNNNLCYTVKVSWPFLVWTTVASMLLAFGMGRWSRMVVLVQVRRALHPASSGGGGKLKVRSLPSPILPQGKEFPRTVYTSKNFDTAASASSLTLHMIKSNDGMRLTPPAPEMWTDCEDKESCPPGKDAQKRQAEAAEMEHDDNDGDDIDEEHLPAGQHLLVDIKHVDAHFLNSEQRLAQAMIDVVAESQLTLLSYHCHTLTPSGISCVGVLLESHVSFHTWPEDGVITLDLFTCGSKPLVPVIPLIERLFAVPARRGGGGGGGERLPRPEMIWAHKLRGFRPETSRRNALASDLGIYTLGSMDFDLKEEVFSVETDFQRIDIYDVIRPRFRDTLSYRKSISNDGSYEALHPQLYKKERVLHLDGVMQSMSYGEAAYHEALVHPAMFAHENPQRVAIIGGGEGATLREVLKHNTVQTAKMIEIDRELVMISRRYLPQWSDCSDLQKSAKWCGDDPRAELHFTDALEWFRDRFLDNADQHQDERLDVIIMDALDPQDDVKFSGALYRDSKFAQSIYNALTDNGVYVMQLGEAPVITDAPYDFPGENENKSLLLKALKEAGFESLHEYHEAHGGFLAPWSFLVAFKNYESRVQWFSSVANVNLAIHKRTRRTKSGASPLHNFDGATMAEYQIPHKTFETIYCRSTPRPAMCHLFGDSSSAQGGVALSALQIKEFTKRGSPSVDRAVFAKENIPKGSLLVSEKSSDYVFVPPISVETMEETGKEASKPLKAVAGYLQEYGLESHYWGRKEIAAESSIAMFTHQPLSSAGGSSSSSSVTSKVARFLQGRPEKQTMLYQGPVEDRHIGSYRMAQRCISEGPLGQQVGPFRIDWSFGSRRPLLKEVVLRPKDECVFVKRG